MLSITLLAFISFISTTHHIFCIVSYFTFFGQKLVLETLFFSLLQYKVGNTDFYI